MKYELSQTMLFDSNREEMRRPIIVESINTGSQWRLTEDELSTFFTGRNKNWYRTYKQF